jgi:hypothetical protein
VTDDDSEDLIDWHLMLLDFGGRLTDGSLVRCRELLAEDRLPDLATTLLAAINDDAVELYETEVELLADLLIDVGIDPASLREVPITIGAEHPYLFAATQDSAPAGAEPAAGAGSSVDAAAISAVAELAGVVGVWRAWRSRDEEAVVEPRRVYVIEVEPDANLVAICATIQRALATAGEADPQVEVYPQGTELSIYHRFARAHGELIWARSPDAGVQIATVFDEVDPASGPRFTAEHPVADEDEMPKLLEYLSRGELLLLTTARLDDVVEPERGNGVPMSFRTDGTWVWSDATAYYLETYRLMPDQELVAHIRTAEYLHPVVDGPARYRAMEALLAPSDEEPAWVFGGLR